MAQACYMAPPVLQLIGDYQCFTTCRSCRSDDSILGRRNMCVAAVGRTTALRRNTVGLTHCPLFIEVKRMPSSTGWRRRLRLRLSFFPRRSRERHSFFCAGKKRMCSDGRSRPGGVALVGSRFNGAERARLPPWSQRPLKHRLICHRWGAVPGQIAYSRGGPGSKGHLQAYLDRTPPGRQKTHLTITLPTQFIYMSYSFTCK